VHPLGKLVGLRRRATDETAGHRPSGGAAGRVLPRTFARRPAARVSSTPDPGPEATPMTRLSAAALLLMTTTSAFAQGTVTFEIEGQRVRIEAPRNCASLSCLSVSIPGVFEMGRSTGRVAGLRTEEPAPRPAPLAAPQQAPAVEAPAAKPLSEARAPTSPLPPQAAPQPAAPETMRSAALPPEPAPAPAPTAAPSPLGVWATEGGKDLVRIETCGANLCGYAVKADAGANGQRVLIDMKPAGEKWSGRIHDPKSGRTYDATIALQGGGLRVQGCAFGGLFCGGQTWTRAG
jgi:uncharacterized protein (DUF2147 family)